MSFKFPDFILPSYSSLRFKRTFQDPRGVKYPFPSSSWVTRPGGRYLRLMSKIRS